MGYGNVTNIQNPRQEPSCKLPKLFASSFPSPARLVTSAALLADQRQSQLCLITSSPIPSFTLLHPASAIQPSVALLSAGSLVLGAPAESSSPSSIRRLQPSSCSESRSSSPAGADANALVSNLAVALGDLVLRLRRRRSALWNVPEAPTESLSPPREARRAPRLHRTFPTGSSSGGFPVKDAFSQPRRLAPGCQHQLGCKCDPPFWLRSMTQVERAKAYHYFRPLKITLIKAQESPTCPASTNDGKNSPQNPLNSGPTQTD